MPPKILVACSGGGLRGAAQVGMLQAITAHGIGVDAWTGVSTGAIQAAFMSQAPPTRTEQLRQATQLVSTWRSLTRAPVGGGKLGAVVRVLLGNESLHTADPLRELLDAAILTAPRTPVELGTVSLNGGDYVGRRPTTAPDLRTSVLASAAVPAYFPPVGPDAHVDGGVIHVAPLKPAFKLANDLWHTSQPVIILLLHCLPLDQEKLPPTVAPATKMAGAPIWNIIARAVDIVETNNERGDLKSARQFNDLVRMYEGVPTAPSWLAGKRYAPVIQIAPTVGPGYDMLEFDAAKLVAYITHGQDRANAVLEANLGMLTAP